MKRLAILLATSSMMVSCATDTNAGNGGAPEIVYVHDTAVENSMQVCEVSTLAEQRLAMLDEAHSYRETIAQAQYGSDTNLQTQVIELVAAFETDLDASYRFATTSCRTYNICLQENRFGENTCMQTAAMWRDSQTRFHELSAMLAEVRERIARSCGDCSTGRRHHGRGGHAANDSRGDARVGSIFSSGTGN
jgi:hypothetical protein